MSHDLIKFTGNQIEALEALGTHLIATKSMEQQVADLQLDVGDRHLAGAAAGIMFAGLARTLQLGPNGKQPSKPPFNFTC